ncbi:MAG: phosphodiester glycosidase family protein [Prochlorothrix sp.]
MSRRSPLFVTTLALLGLGLTADLGFQRHTFAQSPCDPASATLAPPSPLPDRYYPLDRPPVAQGEWVCWNQTRLAVPWIQWHDPGAIGSSSPDAAGSAIATSIGIADWGLESLTGARFQTSRHWASQPLDWFPVPRAEGSALSPDVAVYLTATHRYLDLAPLLDTLGATVHRDGPVLRVTTPPAQVLELRPYPEAAMTVAPLFPPVPSVPAPGTAPDGSPGSPQPLPPPLQELEIFLDRPVAWTWEAGSVPTLRLSASLVPDLRVPTPDLPPGISPVTLPPDLSTAPSQAEGTGFPSTAANPAPAGTLTNPISPAAPWQAWGNLPLRVQTQPQGVRLQFPTLRQQPRLIALPDPPRLVVALEQPVDPYPERTIAWAPGLTWQQTQVTVGSDRFPVHLLRLDRSALANPLGATAPAPSPESGGFFFLHPLWVGQGDLGGMGTRPSGPRPNLAERSIVGITPLLSLARQSQVMAALNGTYFNRNTQMPLGALRFQGEWISGPILDRGVMAWNDAGAVVFDRAVLTETVTLEPLPQSPNRASVGAPVSFPVLFLNSGYLKAGLSRYTAAWGDRYQSMTDNETAIIVVDDGGGDRVQQIQRLGPAGSTTVPIPLHGYILVARSYQTAANQFAVGQPLRLTSTLEPPYLSEYPHILGAGPLLLQGGRSVLDGRGEQFDNAFLGQGAYRSAVGITAQGQLLWITVQPRLGGPGPTLSQLVVLLQNLGVTDALNLDGGSSTSLYLGDRLINRDPRTAARVHNGLGLFFTPHP